MVKILLFSLFVSLSAVASALSFKDIKDINGQNLLLTEKDEKVFLYFWAYWCPDCEGKIKSFFPKYKDKLNARLIMINTDSKEGKVRGFIEKNKMDFLVVMDSDKIFRKTTAVNSVPGWALFSREKNGEYKMISAKNGFDETEVLKILGVN